MYYDIIQLHEILIIYDSIISFSKFKQSQEYADNSSVNIIVNNELISLRKIMYENSIIMNENITLVVYNECFHGNIVGLCCV